MGLRNLGRWHKQQGLRPNAHPTHAGETGFILCASDTCAGRERVFTPEAGQPPDPDQASDPHSPPELWGAEMAVQMQPPLQPAKILRGESTTHLLPSSEARQAWVQAWLLSSPAVWPWASYSALLSPSFLMYSHTQGTVRKKWVMAFKALAHGMYSCPLWVSVPPLVKRKDREMVCRNAFIPDTTSGGWC